MFRVEYHYQGQGLWNRGAAPMTQLVAAMHARQTSSQCTLVGVQWFARQAGHAGNLARNLSIA